MSIVVGVDAGGSSTRIVAERDGANAGAFEAQAANVRRNGADEAAEIIARGIESLLHGDLPSAVMVGAAGAGHADLASSLRLSLQERLPGARVAVDDDAFIALRAGAPAGDGLVLVAGTGSIALACAHGERVRAGGHGYLLDDEGSGAAIGAAAVRLLLRAFDQRIARDGLLDAIALQLQAKDAADVHERVYGCSDPVRLLASFAPYVIEAASAGERNATKIVQHAALELFDLIKTVTRRARIGSDEMPVVLAGGLLSGNSMLTYLLETRIANEFPHLEPRKGVDPANGALGLARELLPA